MQTAVKPRLVTQKPSEPPRPAQLRDTPLWFRMLVAVSGFIVILVAVMFLMVFYLIYYGADRVSNFDFQKAIINYASIFTYILFLSIPICISVTISAPLYYRNITNKGRTNILYFVSSIFIVCTGNLFYVAALLSFVAVLAPGMGALIFFIIPAAIGNAIVGVVMTPIIAPLWACSLLGLDPRFARRRGAT